MKLTAREISEIVQGSLSGNENKILTGIAPLESAKESDLSFVSDQKYMKLLAASQAGTLLLKTGTPVANNRTVIYVDDPQAALIKILILCAKEKEKLSREVHPTALVAKSAKIGPNVEVGAYSIIEEEVSIGEGSVISSQCYVGKKSVLGKNCRIYPQVVIREEVLLHDNVIIHSGTTIGSDGFGYAMRDGVHHKIPQIGKVEIHDDVEIGANVAIDRATIGTTVIGKGTKIDNLVQIAHNVQIGEGCLLVSQAGIAGSSKLGNYVTLAGQVGVVGHVTIGDKTIVAAQSGIPSDLPPNSIVFGSPARPIQEEKRIQVIIGKLPKIYEEFKKIKKKLNLSDVS